MQFLKSIRVFSGPRNFGPENWDPRKDAPPTKLHRSVKYPSKLHPKEPDRYRLHPAKQQMGGLAMEVALKRSIAWSDHWACRLDQTSNARERAPRMSEPMQGHRRPE